MESCVLQVAMKLSINVLVSPTHCVAKKEKDLSTPSYRLYT